MAAKDGNDEPKPPRRKRDLEDWANNDRRPTLPNPGQIIVKKKGKLE